MARAVFGRCGAPPEPLPAPAPPLPPEAPVQPTPEVAALEDFFRSCAAGAEAGAPRRGRLTAWMQPPRLPGALTDDRPLSRRFALATAAVAVLVCAAFFTGAGSGRQKTVVTLRASGGGGASGGMKVEYQAGLLDLDELRCVEALASGDRVYVLLEAGGTGPSVPVAVSRRQPQVHPFLAGRVRQVRERVAGLVAEVFDSYENLQYIAAGEVSWKEGTRVSFALDRSGRPCSLRKSGGRQEPGRFQGTLVGYRPLKHREAVVDFGIENLPLPKGEAVRRELLVEAEVDGAGEAAARAAIIGGVRVPVAGG